MLSPNQECMFKKVLIAISIIILPAIFCMLIYNQITQIRKSRNDFHLNEGRIENFGIIEKNNKGSFKSPQSNSQVFFIKLENNDTLYSYFSRNAEKKSILKRKLKIGEVVKIFNEGYDEKQNTVDIVELEKDKEILVNKSEFDRNAYILLTLFSVFLVLYFYIPYKLLYLKTL